MSAKSKTVHAVAIASYVFAGSTATVVAAIVKAAEGGQDTASIRAEFMAGRIARAMLGNGADKATDKARDVAITKGLHIVAACEPGRKPARGQAIRTAEEQALFEPTKRWWSRMGRDAGVIKPRAPKAKPEGKPEKNKPEANKPAAFFAKAPKDRSAATLSLQNMMHEIAAYAAKHHKKLAVEIVAFCNSSAIKLDELAKAE